ncbi:DNA primase [Candidatus Peregrinibacteria bacterium]|nr:DNA primase [Candidatus Peregrinibacteria bacterium]
MNHLEEIRAKLGIEEVVGSYIQLKKAGRNLKGICPFHNDTKPSFTVSPEKGIGYCFACNTGGDIFKFVQLIENVDFPEAVRILAQRANVSIPEFKPEAHNQRMKVVEMNSSSVKYFAEQLQSSPEHKKYFLDRGLTEDTIRKFKLGYAPDSYNGLKDHLINIGYRENDILSAGLLNQRSIADKNTYDRFRNRYIFPIFDHQDNAIGFGGRIIGDGEPKYLNSPDTLAYNKSLVLYGLNWGKDAVKKEDLAIFVEGYMDVIACHQAGCKNTVATSGTALTVQQLKLIKRYTPNIAFAFDQDSAGLEATKRSIELAQEAEMNIKIITVPEGKDPDECIKKSPDMWFEAVKQATPVMDFYISYILRLHDKNTLDGKKEILNFLLPIIKNYNSEVEQGAYLDKISLALRVDVKLLWNDLKNLTIKKSYSPPTTNTQEVLLKKAYSREEFLLGFIFQYPDLYKLVDENLIDSVPLETGTEKFYKAIKKVYNRASAVDLDAVKEELDEEDRGKIEVYALLIDDIYPDFSEESAEKEIKLFISLINKKNIDNAEKELIFKIRSAKDSGESTLLLNQQIQISKLKTKIF